MAEEPVFIDQVSAERRSKMRRVDDVLSLDEFIRLEELLDCVRHDELKGVIKSAVAEALATYKHTCILNIDCNHVKEIPLLFSTLQEIGDGDLATGIHTVRDNHKLIARYCKVTGNVGTTIITGIVIAVVTLLGSTLAFGFLEKLRGIVK